MKEKIIIIGGNGTAVVIAEQLIHAIEKCNYNAEFLGFAFWDPSMTEVLGRPILFQDYEEMKKQPSQCLYKIRHLSANNCFWRGHNSCVGFIYSHTINHILRRLDQLPPMPLDEFIKCNENGYYLRSRQKTEAEGKCKEKKKKKKIL